MNSCIKSFLCEIKLILKNLIKSNLLIFILLLICFLLFALVKFYFRHLAIENNTAQFILGISPNLIAALVMSLSCLLVYNSIDINYISKFHQDFKLYLIVLFILFIADEYYPLISDNSTFDYFDIIASFIGLIIGYQVFLYLKKLRLKKIILNKI